MYVLSVSVLLVLIVREELSSMQMFLDIYKSM